MRIALPTMIGSIGMIVFDLTHMFWVGQLGSKAVAAMGTAGFMRWLLIATMNVTAVGCTTLVSQAFGAKDKREANAVVRETLYMSLVIAAVLLVVFSIYATDIFRLMGLDAETHKFVMEFFSVWILGMPMVYLFVLTGAIFIAYGDTKTSTIIMAVILLLNLVLDPILIFGMFGLPKLGMTGAAVAALTCQCVGVALRVYYLRKKGYISSLKSFLKISFKRIPKILQIGVPVALTSVTWSLVYPLLTTIITRFGMEPLAALSLGHRIESISFLMAMGFSTAIAALVGQAFGRGDKDQIPKILHAGLKLSCWTMAPIAFLFVTVPEYLVMVINTDPEVVGHCASYLRIVGYFELFMAFEIGVQGAFNGIGNTKPSMYICIPLTLSRIPLAYFLAINLGFGTSGIWWAISVTTMLKGVILFIAFKVSKRNKELLGPGYS